MAESPFSWRSAERMYRPYCGASTAPRREPRHPHSLALLPGPLPALLAAPRSQTEPPQPRQGTWCSPRPLQLREVLTVQLPAHRFWIAPAEASRMAGVLLSFSREMYIRTTSGWNRSS